MCIGEIADYLKTIFALPQIPENKDFISLEVYLKTLEEKNLKLNDFFINEIRRLFCFRYLMCLKSNFEVNIAVVLMEKGKVSRLDYPISINEKNYCFASFNSSSNIPKTVIKKWFNNSIEFFHDFMKSFIENLNLVKEIDFKYKIIDHIKKKYKYDGDIVFWFNSILERLRIYNN
jgi:hypothetical protein